MKLDRSAATLKSTGKQNHVTHFGKLKGSVGAIGASHNMHYKNQQVPESVQDSKGDRIPDFRRCLTRCKKGRLHSVMSLASAHACILPIRSLLNRRAHHSERESDGRPASKSREPVGHPFDRAETRRRFYRQALREPLERHYCADLVDI